MDRPITALNLDNLSDAQRGALARLRVSERQEFHGGSFAESLEAWTAGPRSNVIGFCFHHDDEPVGMTLFKRPPLSPPWVREHAASLHGLKIALPWQRRGWGHLSLALAVEGLKEEWSSVSALMLAVDADNPAALAVYRAFGMADSGAVFEGNHGPEHRMELSLRD